MILVDTDVLVDVATQREPHAGSSMQLLDLLERRSRMAFVSWHTLSNFYYIVRPIRGATQARAFLLDVTRFALVVPTDAEAFRYAASLEIPNLEDAMQIGAAWACGAQWIATRNVNDFRKSPIPARRPEQLLKELA